MTNISLKGKWYCINNKWYSWSEYTKYMWDKYPEIREGYPLNLINGYTPKEQTVENEPSI